MTVTLSCLKVHGHNDSDSERKQLNYWHKLQNNKILVLTVLRVSHAAGEDILLYCILFYSIEFTNVLKSRFYSCTLRPNLSRSGGQRSSGGCFEISWVQRLYVGRSEGHMGQ